MPKFFELMKKNAVKNIAERPWAFLIGMLSMGFGVLVAFMYFIFM